MHFSGCVTLDCLLQVWQSNCTQSPRSSASAVQWTAVKGLAGEPSVPWRLPALASSWSRSMQGALPPPWGRVPANPPPAPQHLFLRHGSAHPGREIGPTRRGLEHSSWRDCRDHLALDPHCTDVDTEAKRNVQDLCPSTWRSWLRPELQSTTEEGRVLKKGDGTLPGCDRQQWFLLTL